jgi:hypothetical protein
MGDELERAYFGSVKNKHEGMKMFGIIREENYIGLSEALKIAEMIQPSEISPIKPDKPFAFDLRRTVWKKINEIASSASEEGKARRAATTVNLLSLESKNLRFYSTVQFSCMDRAAHVDGYFVLSDGSDERIVLCDVTGNEAAVPEKQENVDVVILSKRILDKNEDKDKKEWEGLIEKYANEIVDKLLGPKENLKTEGALKNTPLKTNIKFPGE